MTFGTIGAASLAAAAVCCAEAVQGAKHEAAMRLALRSTWFFIIVPSSERFARDCGAGCAGGARTKTSGVQANYHAGWRGSQVGGTERVCDIRIVNGGLFFFGSY